MYYKEDIYLNFHFIEESPLRKIGHRKCLLLVGLDDCSAFSLDAVLFPSSGHHFCDNLLSSCLPFLPILFGIVEVLVTVNANTAAKQTSVRSGI